MNEKELFRRIGGLDDDLIAEAANHRRVPVRRLAAAACAVLIVAASVGMYRAQQRIPFALEHSTGDVSVEVVSELAEYGESACLAYMTEEELVTDSQTDIMRGTVTDIQNVLVSCGDWSGYRAVIEVKTDYVYRTYSGCKAGDTVYLLAPGPIRMETQGMSGLDTVRQIEVGMEGIFMGRPYGENDVEEQDGSRLYWMDVARYGLPDGIRYAFLQTDSGLLFDRDAYPSFSDAQTLDEVAEGLEKLISP